MKSENEATLLLAKKAEEVLLGCILMSGAGPTSIIEEAKAIIKPEDFMDAHWTAPPGNRRARIFEAMTHCQNPSDLAVARELDRMGRLQASDMPYMCDLVIAALDEQAFYLDWEEYAKMVKALSIKRRLRHHAEQGNIRGILDVAEAEYRGGVRISERL